MFNTHQLFEAAYSQLKDAGFEDGEARASLNILLKHSSAISSKKSFDAQLQRLINGEPLQYILEEAFFYKNIFRVGPSVLIPRPETEELVDLVIRQHHPKKNAVTKILDIGTGSGCIAISLAKALGKNAEVWATDISTDALSMAHYNSEQLDAIVHFRQDDILDSAFSEADFDILISNPPYIKTSEKVEMASNVLDFEPHLALFVEDERPLLFYEKIAMLSQKLLKSGGKLYFEINQAHGNEVMKMLQLNHLSQVVIHQDINGNDRIVEARTNN